MRTESPRRLVTKYSDPNFGSSSSRNAAGSFSRPFSSSFASALPRNITPPSFGRLGEDGGSRKQVSRSSNLSPLGPVPPVGIGGVTWDIFPLHSTSDHRANGKKLTRWCQQVYEILCSKRRAK